MYRFFGIYLLAALLTFSYEVSAQVLTDSLVTINGQLKDLDEMPVPYAHIINQGLGLGTTSDSLGFFTIHMRFGDSLHISAIGFNDKYFQLPKFWFSNHFSGIMHLRYKIYEIEEVSIQSWGTYAQFKQKVLNTRIPPPPAEEASLYLQRMARAEAIKYNKVQVGFSFHMRSPEERSLRKLKEKMEEERKRDIIVQKFNENNVGQLTGLKGDELRSFMNYCRFPEDFLLYSSEYDILKAVKRIYSRYYHDLDIR